MGDQSKVSHTQKLLEPQNGYGPIMSDAWYAQAKREHLNAIYLQLIYSCWCRKTQKLKMHQQKQLCGK